MQRIVSAYLDMAELHAMRRIPMTMSETYKGEIAVIDPAKLQSRTFYVGIKGDEVADYSYNYKLGTETVKTTTFFLYSGARAALAPSDAAMTTSETYKGAFTDIPSIVDHIIQSRTYYAGEKGEEVADFTHNFGQLKKV